jgi:hypothetical protein
LGSKASCVHGHLDISQYLKYHPKLLVTFLRDPVERIISYYLFLKAHNPDSIMLSKIVNDPDVSAGIVNFAKIFSHDYHHWFSGVDLDRFDYVGIVERYDDSINSINDLIGYSGSEISSTRINVSPSRINVSPSPDIKNNLLNDNSIVSVIKDICSDDIDIYNYFHAKFHS